MNGIIGSLLVCLVFAAPAFCKDNFGPTTPDTGVFSLDFESDLNPLSIFFDDHLKNVDVVGIGENIHGTHEPHIIRLNAIKLLVEKFNFRAVAFESPWVNSLVTKKYVETCQGSLKSAQTGLVFAAWYDQSTADLLQWLCQYNQKHPADPVTLFGFDIQNPKKSDQIYLTGFFQKVDSSYWNQVSLDLAKCTQVGDPAQSPSDLAICINLLQVLSKRISDFAKPYATLSSSYEVFLAQTSVKSIRAWQYENSYHDAHDISKEYESRDSGMAEVFNDFREFFGGKKAVVYAHNHHVAFNMDHRNPQTSIVAKTMGTYLKDQIGAKYLSVGFLAYETQINHQFFPDPPYANPPLPQGVQSIEKRLHDAGFASAFIVPNKGFLMPNTSYEFNDEGYAWQQAGDPFEFYDLLFFSNKSIPLIYPY